MNKAYVVVLSLIGSLLLSGCTSTQENLQYYLLHDPSHNVSTSSPSKGQVAISKIMLPDYLKQRGLVMQTSPAQLYISPQHVWAEPLDEGFVQALDEALWSKNQFNTLPSAIARERDDVAVITIKISDFITTFDGKVLLKGQYWMKKSSKNARLFYFDYRITLSEDGFEHAVIKMRNVIERLATDIAQKVTTDN